MFKVLGLHRFSFFFILGSFDSTPANENSQSIMDMMGGDVYESISDEDLDLFDDIEEEGAKLPKPVSVMEVDWSLLSKMNKPASSSGEYCLLTSLIISLPVLAIFLPVFISSYVSGCFQFRIQFDSLAPSYSCFSHRLVLIYPIPQRSLLIYDFLQFMIFLEENGDVPEILKKLSPGHVLSNIGYAPSLLSKKTLKRVQDAVLKARDIDPNSLDVSELQKLRSGMAVSVRNCIKQRFAKRALFMEDLIGLRNDLAMRRELRKPTAKVRYAALTAPIWKDF